MIAIRSGASPPPESCAARSGRLQGLCEIAACFGDPSFDQRTSGVAGLDCDCLLEGTLSAREIMLVVQNQGISARGGTRLRIQALRDLRLADCFIEAT